MEEPTKPHVIDDLPQPFQTIGEPGWAGRAKAVLEAYGVDPAQPAAKHEVDQLQDRAGASLPAAYRQFLLELGPVDFDGIRLVPPSEVANLTSIWFRDQLTSDDQARLDKMIGVADHLGSGDVIALEPGTGRCCLCSHDPPGFSNWLASFDDLARLGFLLLPASVYGWPDQAVIDLVAKAQSEIFKTML